MRNPALVNDGIAWSGYPERNMGYATFICRNAGKRTPEKQASKQPVYVVCSRAYEYGLGAHGAIDSCASTGGVINAAFP